MSTSRIIYVAAVVFLVTIARANAAINDCSLNCRDLESNDTTSRRDRCAVWYTLQHLELNVGVWIQQLPCEMYVEQSNETFSEDFIKADNFVLELNFTGKVKGGSLAPQVADFSMLQSFYCSDCNLTGTVPPTWAWWTYIQNLDLSRNNLLGPLPQAWTAYPATPGLPATLNFSHNPHLNGSILPYFVNTNPDEALIDINDTALHQPMEGEVLAFYCWKNRPTTFEAPEPTMAGHVKVVNGTQDLCSPLNFRGQVGWAWVLFIVVCLGSVVAMMLVGHDPGELALDEFTRGQIEDLEVSYLPLPSSALAYHSGYRRYQSEDDGQEIDDHDPLPIGPPRFSKLSMLVLVALAGVQVGLDAPHAADTWEGRRRPVWLLLLLVPHVSCATVLHAAMFKNVVGWMKVVLAYASIPLIMINMPVTWVLGAVRETINVPQNLCCSAVQVCIGLILLPLVIIPIPTILLLLLLMIIGWPEMDYQAFGRNASRVFKQLKLNSYTYTMMLHWSIALVQAPLSAIFITFFYAFWFNEDIFFNERRRHWLTAEFVMSLITIWAHLIVLVRMPSSRSGDLFQRTAKRLQAAQLDLDPILPPSHPIAPPNSDEPTNPLLSGEEIPTTGVLQPPEQPPRRDGIALSYPGVEAEKEMILGVQGSTPVKVPPKAPALATPALSVQPDADRAESSGQEEIQHDNEAGGSSS